jgi:hypothetical protein
MIAARYARIGLQHFRSERRYPTPTILIDITVQSVHIIGLLLIRSDFAGSRIFEHASRVHNPDVVPANSILQSVHESLKQRCRS